jgi:hypothetical protein
MCHLVAKHAAILIATSSSALSRFGTSEIRSLIAALNRGSVGREPTTVFLVQGAILFLISVAFANYMGYFLAHTEKVQMFLFSSYWVVESGDFQLI